MCKNTLQIIRCISSPVVSDEAGNTKFVVGRNVDKKKTK